MTGWNGDLTPGLGGREEGVRQGLGRVQEFGVYF